MGDLIIESAIKFTIQNFVCLKSNILRGNTVSFGFINTFYSIHTMN